MNASIRKRLFIYMLILTVVVTVSVTGIALFNTYSTLKQQLIYDRRMSIGWLEERLYLETRSDMNRFYEVEVDKTLKNEIIEWYVAGDALGYHARLDLIDALNMMISLDNNINAVELYNLGNDTMLLAERPGASFVTTNSRLESWNARDSSLQTNVVYLRSEREIVALHQIFRFEDKRPIALMAIRLRPYKLQRVLDDLKITSEESILIFNDQDELIIADYGQNEPIVTELSAEMMERFTQEKSSELSCEGNTWFYREVDGGKLRILQAVPEQVIMQTLSKTLIGGLAAALLAILIAVVASALFAKLVSKPLVELATCMRTFALDDSVTLAYSDRGDEIGLLQNSFADMIERTRTLVAKEYLAKLEKRNAQMRALQAQINPHFIYNTLQAIGGMALKNHAPEIYETTLDLVSIMRYSLNFGKDMVRLDGEIRYLDHYLNIQNKRFGRRLDIGLDVPGKLHNCLVPKLILQPLLENCFEHGLANKEGRWLLHISAVCEGDRLTLTVSDNGVGMPPEKMAEIQNTLAQEAGNSVPTASHIGLANVDARIRLQFPGDPYGIFIKSTQGEGTAISAVMQAIFSAEEA